MSVDPLLPDLSRKDSRLRSRLGTFAVYAFMAAALYWVFHDVHWNALIDQAQQISWPWLCAIIAFDVFSFYVQGVRWHFLLRPCGRISPLKATQAIYVGLFSSEVLPLRAGEIVRGVLVSKWLSRKFREVLPSMAVERLLDALWFSAVMALVALLVPIPRQIRTIAFTVLVAALLGMALFAWNANRKHRLEAALEAEAGKPGGWTRELLQEVTLGLKQIGFSRPFWAATAFSGFLHVVQALAFLAVLQACRIDLPLIASIAVFLIVQLGIAIPNAPANVGTFQLFCVLGLTFFGIDKSAAAAVSVVAFAILTFPVLLIGAMATVHAGLSLTGFRSQIREMAATAAAPESAT